jgi:hypothetical protein
MSDDFAWLPEATMIGNGKWHSSLSGKGIPEEYDNGTTQMVRLAVDPKMPAFPVTAGVGATVNKGNFESARVHIHVQAVGDIRMIEETSAFIEAVAGEFLNREVAVIHERERTDKDLPDCPEHIQYLIVGLTYGLTINLGNYNSRKVDLGYSIPCRTEDYIEAFEKVSEYLGGRIQNKINALRGNKPKKGGTGV